jgi:hypothetical protein
VKTSGLTFIDFVGDIKFCTKEESDLERLISVVAKMGIINEKKNFSKCISAEEKLAGII